MQVSYSVSLDLVFIDGGLEIMWNATVAAHFKALFLLELWKKTVRIVIGTFGIPTRLPSAFYGKKGCVGQKKQSTAKKHNTAQFRTPRRSNIPQCINETCKKSVVKMWWNNNASVHYEDVHGLTVQVNHNALRNVWRKELHRYFKCKP